MTTIKEYLSLEPDEYNQVVFEPDEVLLNGIPLMFYDYDDGGMTLYDLEHNVIFNLNMTELIEIFPTLRDKAICSICKGSKKTLASYDPNETEFIDCQCEEVIYPI